MPEGLNPKTGVGGTPARVWLDAPRAQIFCARGCPERSEFSRAPEVFREGAENGTRGRVRSPFLHCSADHQCPRIFVFQPVLHGESQQAHTVGRGRSRAAENTPQMLVDM